MIPLIKFVLLLGAFAAAALGLYFVPNIHGYYRFKSICSKEGGLKVYQPLQKGVGWFQTKGGGGGSPLVLYGASYVRSQKEDGKYYDTTMKMPIQGPYYERDFDRYFAVSIADLSKQPVYELKWIVSPVPDEVRLIKYITQVVDIKTGALLVNYTYFGYEVFVRANTLLDAPSGSHCPEYAVFGPQDRNGELTRGEMYLGIQSAIK